MQATTQDRPGAWVVPALVALALGATLWIVGGVVSGRKEPWDTGVYWTGVYPLSLLGGMLMARGWPARAWRWPLLVFLGQFVGVALRNGEVGNLWPLAIAMFLVLSLPGIALARLAARGGRGR